MTVVDEGLVGWRRRSPGNGGGRGRWKIGGEEREAVEGRRSELRLSLSLFSGEGRRAVGELLALR